MLSKQYRVPSFCFKRIYQKGKTKKGNFIILKSLENRKSFSRFGLVVSTKVVKNATDRNLIKRRASEILNGSMDRIQPGFDFIFIIKKEADFNQLREELKNLLNV